MYNYIHAWLVDKQKDERLRGITMHSSRNLISTQKRQYTLINTPGLHTYVKTTILGIIHADCALLVVTTR
jgi:translation elongation factor EF-1alpha